VPTDDTPGAREAGAVYFIDARSTDCPTLMIPFAMIVLDELGNGSPERPFTDENESVEAGLLDYPHEPLRECVEIRRVSRQADNLHAGGGESRRMRR
jgi:hypothetical protein